MAKKIPLDEMSQEEFAEFREDYLNPRKLSLEALDEIRKLFGGTSDFTGITGRVCCDEAHLHSYACLEFYDSRTAVVTRLLDEIERYQAKLADIHKKSAP